MGARASSRAVTIIPDNGSQSISATLGGAVWGTGVTVYYSGGTHITWNLTGIVVTTQPTKTTYSVGELFDPSGMVIEATYEDTSNSSNTKTEVITDYTYTPDGELSASDAYITISYGDFTTTTPISVTQSSGSQTATLTIASGNSFSTTSPATKKDDKDNEWTMTSSNIGAYNNDYKGQQIGTSKAPTSATVSATINKTITMIVVKAGTGGSATLSVKVGDTDFTCNSDTSVNVSSGTANGGKEYTFIGNAQGSIVITLSGTSKACYYGGHTVTYNE